MTTRLWNRPASSVRCGTPSNIEEKPAGPITAPPSVSPNAAEPLNIHIGPRIRLRRILLGLSQTDLAALIGQSLQQIQDYEQGASIPTATLHFLSLALDVPVSFFLNGLPENKPIRPHPSRR